MKIVDIKKNSITQEQADELADVLNQCDTKYKETVWEALHKSKVSNLIDLPIDMYERLKKAANIKAAENYQDVPF